MWKFIVTWCLINMGYYSVPSYPVDEFGRESNSYYYDSYLSWDCDHNKVFYDHDSAFSFYDRALNGNNIDSVKIDSVYIDTSSYEGITGLYYIIDSLISYSICDTLYTSIDTIKVEIMYSCPPVVCIIEGYIVDAWDYTFYDKDWNKLDIDKIWDYKTK